MSKGNPRSEAWANYYANHPEAEANWSEANGREPSCICADCDPNGEVKNLNTFKSVKRRDSEGWRRQLLEWRRQLLQHLDKDEERWTPNTVGFSGDSRGGLTASCAGPSHTGDCREQWSIGPDGNRDDWAWLIREHSTTHATYDQLWHLADINAKRRVVAKHGNDGDVLLALLLPYGLPRDDEDEGWDQS